MERWVYLSIILIITGMVFAQVPSRLWTHELLSHCYGSPACADIDGDGYLEIVFGTYFDDEHAYALNAEDGSELWRFDVGGGPLDAAPVIFDVDGDDSLEVIIPASWGIVYCLSSTGYVEWRYPPSGYIDCIDSPPAIADTDEDGFPEVVFGAWFGKVYVLNGEDGSLVWERTYCDTGYIQSAPCILDCDDDGHLDIVVAMFRGDCKVYALNGQTGDTLWTYQAADWMYAGAATSDIDEDGLPELVIGDYSGTVFALNAEDGSLIWERTLATYIFPPVTIAELVPDSPGPEILAAEYTLFCLASTGDTLWTVPTGGMIDRGAIVVEIDGDSHPEVVFGSTDLYLRVVNGEDGSPVWEYETDYGYPIENAPIAADFDLDGWIDIFCIGGRGYSDTIPNYGRAYAIKAGPGCENEWTMYRHDIYRTGCLNGGPTEVCESPCYLPKETEMELYPNPFNSSLNVHIAGVGAPIRAPGQIASLKIFDITGRRVGDLPLPSAPESSEGPTPAIWTPEDGLSSGIYMIEYNIGEKTIIKPAFYIK